MKRKAMDADYLSASDSSKNGDNNINEEIKLLITNEEANNIYSKLLSQ